MPYALLDKITSLEECKFVLSKNKALDIDEMKGLQAFISHLTCMLGKYPEQSKKHLQTIKSSESLVQYLKGKENLPSIEYLESFWLEVAQSRESDIRDTIVDKEAEQLLMPRRYCSKKGDKPLPEFAPSDKIEEGLFVALCAPDAESHLDDQGGPIWVTKVVQIGRNEMGVPITFTALWYEPKPLKSLPKKLCIISNHKSMIILKCNIME